MLACDIGKEIIQCKLFNHIVCAGDILHEIEMVENKGLGKMDEVLFAFLSGLFGLN